MSFQFPHSRLPVHISLLKKNKKALRAAPFLSLFLVPVLTRRMPLSSCAPPAPRCPACGVPSPLHLYPDAVYLRVMKAKYKLPAGKFCAKSKSLMRRLLDAKLETRLTRVDEIKSHPFFSEVDWIAAEDCRLRPPFVPTLESQHDTAHFQRWKIPNYRKASAQENSLFGGF